MAESWIELVEKEFGPGTKIIFPRYFYSKKNQVTLLDMKKGGVRFQALAKYFVWGDPTQEWEVLQQAHRAGLNTPKPININGNVIFMEFIPGRSLKSIADSGENIPAEMLGQWYGKFHRAFKKEDSTILKGDGMLPNFIIHKDTKELYGVDFEESSRGREITEIADFTTTLLSYGDSFSKDNLSRAGNFIKAYLKVNPVLLPPQEIKDLIRQNLARRISFMPELEKEILSQMDFVQEHDIMKLMGV